MLIWNYVMVRINLCLWQGKTIGEFSKDKFPGEFMESWRSALGAASFQKVKTISVSARFIYKWL